MQSVFMDPENILNSVIKACAFLLVLSLWGAVVWSWVLIRSVRGHRVQERLRFGDRDAGRRVLRLWHQGRKVNSADAKKTQPINKCYNSV